MLRFCDRTHEMSEVSEKSPGLSPMASRVPPSPLTRLAVWVLTLVALAQLVAVGWAFSSRLRFAERGMIDPSPVPGGQTNTLAQDTGENHQGPDAVNPEGADSNTGATGSLLMAADDPPEAGPEPPPVTLSDYDPTAVLDPTAANFVRAGIEARDGGDIKAALERFHDALAILPSHPQVLYEIADTYERIGLNDKATAAWEQIYAMGGELAGDLHELADFKLRGANAFTDPLPPPAPALKTGPIRVTPDPASTDGQQVTLIIPLVAQKNAEIDTDRVEVYVYFFDLVDGIRIERTTSDSPKTRWLSSPPDWKGPGGEESLEVVYFHPRLNGVESTQFGKREYYGYIVKIYYGDELVDQVADPPTLFKELIHPASAPQRGNRHDGSLFPGP